MFNDYFHDDADVYPQKMNNAKYTLQYFSAVAYGYEGAMYLQVKMNDYQYYSIIDEQYQ